MPIKRSILGCHGEHVLEKGQKQIFTTLCQYTVGPEKLFVRHEIC